MEASEKKSSAEAGAATFPSSGSRRFNYFTPKGARATLYEDVTVDVQPDVERYLLQGWILAFANGDPTYSKKTTALQSSDWHRFRAPDEEWDRVHYERQAAIEKAISLTIETGRMQGAPARFEPSWVTTLQNHVSALKHPEQGLGTILMMAQRDGYTQMINTAILTNSSYKLRFAQDLTLYLADIARDIKDRFDLDAGKQHWLNDQIWQGAREAVETIDGEIDYALRYFAANVLYEPLVTSLVRRGFIMNFGAAHNDFMTPVIVGIAEANYEQNLINAVEFFRLLCEDAAHSESNRKIVQNWLEKYVPLCTKAANQLQPLWVQTRVQPVAFADALSEAKNRVSTALSQIDVRLPEGVQL